MALSRSLRDTVNAHFIFLMVTIAHAYYETIIIIIVLGWPYQARIMNTITKLHFDGHAHLLILGNKAKCIAFHDYEKGTRCLEWTYTLEIQITRQKVSSKV